MMKASLEKTAARKLVSTTAWLGVTVSMASVSVRKATLEMIVLSSLVQITATTGGAASLGGANVRVDMKGRAARC